ncbi:hypothetical protein ACHAXS_000527 [Conticribra weissflogii]
MIATKLSSALVSPAKVASKLDWQKAVGVVMGLNISNDRIGIAIAEHPENFCESIPLNSLNIQEPDSLRKSRVISNESISELEAIVKQHRVCAFIVNWPVNEGRMGEQCGKVLQVLDSVVGRSNAVVTKRRPFTLWGHKQSSTDSSFPDEWGRSVAFSKAPSSSADMKYSSKTLFTNETSPDESIMATRILDDWIKSHWEVDRKLGKATAPRIAKSQYYFCKISVDEYNSEKACLQVALL